MVMNSKQPTACGAEAPPEAEDVGRNLAIPAIGKAPWGTHFCQFFGTKQDLLDILVPYFQAGLESNEVCLWATAEPLGADEAAEALSRRVVDFERRVAQGQISIMWYEAWYGNSHPIDAERYLKPILPSIRNAMAQGYAGTRTSGNVSWVEGGDWNPFMAYEAALNPVLSNQQTLVVCTYPLAMCDSLKMIDVLMRHRFALIKHGDWTLIEPSEQKMATAAVERMNQALTARTAELRAALADLRGFGRWVTHDLRAPLRSVRGFSDLLAETVVSKMDDDERHLFERIRASTDRMDTLITDILAYSTAQQNALHPESLNLETLTQEVWETLAGTLYDHRVKLRISRMPRTYGDRVTLTQVLANLLGNSIKFTAKTPDPHVEVGARTVDGECVYYVHDNGEGFDPTQADKIFGAFERLHGRGEYEGTGLGLTVVKQIITRHGGRVWAEGAPGAGATFNFTLPTPNSDTPM
jgi:signal transduction histidine kinase